MQQHKQNTAKHAADFFQKDINEQIAVSEI